MSSTLWRRDCTFGFLFLLLFFFPLEVDALGRFLFSFLCSDSSTVPLEVAVTVCIDSEVKALPILFPESSSPGPLLPWPLPHSGLSYCSLYLVLLFLLSAGTLCRRPLSVGLRPHCMGLRLKTHPNAAAACISFTEMSLPCPVSQFPLPRHLLPHPGGPGPTFPVRALFV